MTRFRVHVEYVPAGQQTWERVTCDIASDHPDNARKIARVRYLLLSEGEAVSILKTKRLLKVGA